MQARLRQRRAIHGVDEADYLEVYLMHQVPPLRFSGDTEMSQPCIACKLCNCVKGSLSKTACVLE